MINIKREKRKCILLSNEVAHCLGWWKPKKGILNREKMVFNLIYNLKDYTHIGIVKKEMMDPDVLAIIFKFWFSWCLTLVVLICLFVLISRVYVVICLFRTFNKLSNK